MRSEIAGLLLIAVIGMLVYGNTLNHQFVYDDEFLIQRNPLIKGPGLSKELFSENIRYGAGKETNAYRPLQMLSYRIDYFFWGLNPTGYHLANILLHILAAAAVYLLIKALFFDELAAFLTALLFIAHPIHTEAVSYISGRADPLSALFIILGLYFYIRHQRSNFGAFYYACLAAYLLALFSRESSLIFLLLLPLVDYFCGNNIRLQFKKYIAPAALSLLYLILRIYIVAIPTQTKHYVPTTLIQRLPGIFCSITDYLRLLILPLNLHMEYVMRLCPAFSLKTVSGIAILVFSLTFAFKSLKRRPEAAFAILWFWIAFIPVSNIFALNAFMAEHWMYLPSIGIFFLAGRGLSKLLVKEGRIKTGAIVFTAALVLFYGGMTIYQNRFWREAFTLYQRILEFSPQSSRVHNSLGAVYFYRREYDHAEKEFKQAAAIKPGYADAYNNLGCVYTQKKMHREALKAHLEAVELNPASANFYANLGNAYLMLGDGAKAKQALEQALALYQRKGDEVIAARLEGFIAAKFDQIREDKGK